MIAFFSGYNDGIGGMEIHRDAFLKFFHDKIISVTRYPLITLSYNNNKKEFDNITDLFSFLRKLCPSILFFNDGHWVYEFSLMRSIFQKSKMIMRSGGNEFLKAPWYTDETLKIRQEFWTENINANLNFIIANSQYTRERMRYMGINTGKIIIVRGGVDLQKCLHICKKKKLLRSIFDSNYGTKGKFLLVMVSRLVKFKGHSGFINALKDYNVKNDNLHLVIVGDGPERDNIYKLCKENLQEDQYTLLGSIKHDYALYITAIADCLICPSIEEIRASGNDYYIHTETMGRNLIEAACLKNSIIASNAGAIPELVYENNRMIKLFNWENPHHAIDHLIKITHGSKGKHLTDRFDINICKKYDWKYIFSKIYSPLFEIQKNNRKKGCICFDIDGTIIQPFCSDEDNEKNLELFLGLAKQDYNVIINTAASYENIIVWQPIISKYLSDIILISNGGAKIKAYGKSLPFWDNYVEQQIGITNREIELVCEILTNNKVTYKDIKKIDALYVNLKINGPISSDIEQEINNKMLSFGVFVIGNYNNLKILSININKGAAYGFCKNAIVSSYVDFGFGDNVLDTLFVKQCKYKYYINYKGSDAEDDCNYITINNSGDWQIFLQKTIKIIKGR